MLRYGANDDLKFDPHYFTPKLEDIVEVNSNLIDLGIIISDNVKVYVYVYRWMDPENL